MRKRGPKPKFISTKWSSNLAYAVGLLTTDGCLSSDGRHIDLTSKDKEQLYNFMSCLNIDVKIGRKTSGYSFGQAFYRIQFGRVVLYNFLLEIGFTPNKSRTMGEIKIPEKYFFDFLRGHLDGDGTFYSYWDKRWKSSFMYYTIFVSASKEHIDWIRNSLKRQLGVWGHVTKAKNSSVHHLKYAKNEGFKILKRMYYSRNVICLSRKRLKIEKALSIVGESL